MKGVFTILLTVALSKPGIGIAQKSSMSFFNEHGFAHIQPGKKIEEVGNIIPFNDFADTADYFVEPDKQLYYVSTEKWDAIEGCEELKQAIDHVFIAVDTAQLVNKVIIILKKVPFSNEGLLDLLNKTYSEESHTAGQAEIQGIPLRQHHFWSNKYIQIYYYMPMTNGTFPEIQITRRLDTTAINKYRLTKRSWPKPNLNKANE